MLRCPPTALVLGRIDLLDYEKRQQRRKELETENINQQFARIAVGGLEGPRFGLEVSRLQYQEKQAKAEDNPLQKSPSSLTDEDSRSLSPVSAAAAAEDGIDLLPGTSFDTVEVDHSNENPTRSPGLRSPPIKNEFDYGGFVETQRQQDANNTLERSSPFSAPEDSSTPQHPDARRLRWRTPLPRSPLFLSQNATSPDGRPTTRLSPRVASRVATYNSPGIIFAQPPRRPPRSAPRTLRHQTNSFSFDSSERASAAYEQERVVSNSTDDNTPHLSEDVSLHEELRGSSLQSSRVSSGIPMLHEAPTDNAMDMFDAEEEAQTTSRDFIFSSPGFPLPPPFSSVSRRTSNAESLPSTTIERQASNPATSPIRSQASSPNRGEGEGEETQTDFNASPVVPSREANESPPSGGILTNFITRIASYRVRSPRNRRALSRSPSGSTEPIQTQDQQAPETIIPQTPSRNYRVYNDSLSPASQPQTPANLPEARHQSRFHASYTAPVTRNVGRRGANSINSTDRAGTRRPIRQREALYTPVRTGRRANSPVGMREEGFEGLYGGRENGDEEQNWVEGVRFNNAETRLWGERDARNDGEALRETPEPDDWRVGRRN
ncbi:hypothetical protein EG329_010225 [Mollisiaceae sp. DMI_Dod_QoI]|nr:hypothetical protein EG329_010225 [Helotiales sp. DMI_Dod_QoI]